MNLEALSPTRLEEQMLGKTWATQRMSFWQRLKYFRYTGEWPGVYSEESTEMALQSTVDAERTDGKKHCAQIKLARAKEAGLNIK